MSSFVVLYDSCVLYPAPLRDLLMHLAMTDIYQAKWTNEIHEEWMSNVLLNRPDLRREFLERTRTQMNTHVRDCLVENYQHLIPELLLPDLNDRHVLAAAIYSDASAVITYNLKDFPEKILSRYDIESIHPDEFLVNLLDASPEKVCVAIKNHRTSLKKPPKTVEQYLETLKSQLLQNTVEKLEQHFEYI